MLQTKKELRKRFREELRYQLRDLFLEFSPHESEELIGILFSGYLHGPHADDVEDRTYVMHFYHKLQTFFSFIKNSENEVREMMKKNPGISTDLANEFIKE